MEDKLTTKEYWENYYKRNHTSRKHINTVCSYYDLHWNIFIKEERHSQSMIEIGGFPGRYLAYLSSNYNIIPTCLDYNSDTSQIEESFKVMGVTNYRILQNDFTTYHTDLKYDYVISNGFIEHFEDYDSILDLHIDYLNDNGRLLVMIPNMKGYINFYKYLVDFNNLKIHNLKCMRLKVFKDFAKRHKLKTLYLNYYGGFPLGLHQKTNLIQKIIYKTHRLFFKYLGNKVLQNHPSRFFSSSIIGIFEKQ